MRCNYSVLPDGYDCALYGGKCLAHFKSVKSEEGLDERLLNEKSLSCFEESNILELEKKE